MRIAGFEAVPGPPRDLERAVAQPVPIRSRQRGLSPALLLSLALHLLPLLFLVRWSGTPVEIATPIPVQLVVEQPPPPPPAPAPRAETPAKPPPEPSRERLASEEVEESASEPNDAAAQPPDTPPDPQPVQQAKVEPQPPPPPELRQVASLVPQLQPTLLDRAALALPAPSVEPLPETPTPPAASPRSAPKPRPPQRTAAVTGPPAMRDEYLAHLVTLVRPHLRLLPPELLRGRRGMTSLAIRVLGDGTIARIAVAQSSGYPDIDARVVQIIAAVGRFPPLPPWIKQESWDINFHLRFPFTEAGSEQR